MNETMSTASDSNNDDDEYVFTGVPTTPQSLYAILLFFLALYLVGDCFCSRVLKIVPSLVGYIFVGIAFGPEGFDLLGNNGNNDCHGAARTLVVLGNLGLVLLMVQAGMEMDYEVLQKVGAKGVIIASVGTVLPVTIGTLIAGNYVDTVQSAVAAGCSFGPTSAGIAMNVLGGAKVLSTNDNDNGNDNNHQDARQEEQKTTTTILNLPVGQLIVAAAIVDDILALVALSLLETLTIKNDETDSKKRSLALDMAIPIVSAQVWLFLGGAIALWVFPKLFREFLNRTKLDNSRGNVSLLVLMGMLYVLLPCTYFSRASYLLGAFLSGLCFCRDKSVLQKTFCREFQWLIDYGMKLFFAASIGFQVPVRSFNGSTIGRGCFFALALMGKLAVGLLTPNFYHGDDDDDESKQYKRNRVRDSFVVGFSMMGEAEFAFVVAVFGVTEGLVPPDIYASIVWAILMSTVISPLLLKSMVTFLPYRETDDSEGCEQQSEEQEI